MRSTTVGGHAVVLGASMAGLLTARVLTDSYDRVTVVEREILPPTWPTAGGCRKAFTCTRCTPGAGNCSTSCAPASPSHWCRPAW